MNTPKSIIRISPAQSGAVNVNLVLGAVTCSGKLSLVMEHAEQAADTETMEKIKDKAMGFLLGE